MEVAVSAFGLIMLCYLGGLAWGIASNWISRF